MKKIALFLLTALLIPLQACADDVKWKEGTHYTVLDKPETKTPEVYEFVSFWCGHCYRFEPLVAEIKKSLPEGTKFTKIHVNFMGGASTETQDAATRAMMIGRAMKQEDKLNTAIFKYIHEQRAPVNSLADLKNLYVVNDVDPAEFDKLAASFGVNSMVKKNNKMLEDYRSAVHGTPTFIINGRYQATFTRDMSMDDVKDLIVWLTKQ
ncbi:thiol:disulfide interchange protein DsbA/DsbL [Alteromonas sp. C1M14]|uniref:thiol:disulfide interchange protein DsbA/DsbL n=1 Tax=Alteromonas sp. C1M14 TaxID=2841567 RepID=UPI001C0921CB|nr:thiol:disulfide interchange protein DsbA/DsbL [Alteromonas sp. C1M14]MBU2977597.1 thiol:disulfide interchange protein DsbA/DsbL [Alteromonas sp. C1M14]